MTESLAKQRARRFYSGKACIVTGEKNESEVEWHHLDENSLNDVFENVVPISGNLNGAIEAHRRNSTERIPSPIRCVQLSDTSRDWYDTGSFAKGYGCSRLGAFLSWNHWANPDSAIRFAANALLNLRPIWNLELATDTLHRSIVSPLTRSTDLPNETKAHLAMETGSYFRDAGEPSLAQKWESLAQAFIEKLPKIILQDSMTSRLLQHQSINTIPMGQLKQAISGLRTVAELSGDAYRFGKSNSAVWIIQAMILDGDIDGADDVLHSIESDCGVLEPSGVSIATGNAMNRSVIETIKLHTSTFRRGSAYNLWTLAEILARKADIELKKGRENEALEFAHDAYLCFRFSEIPPSEVAYSEALILCQRRFFDNQRLPRRRIESASQFALLSQELFQMLSSDLR